MTFLRIFVVQELVTSGFPCQNPERAKLSLTLSAQSPSCTHLHQALAFQLLIS